MTLKQVVWTYNWLFEDIEEEMNLISSEGQKTI